MALASSPTRQGQQRSLRMMHQLLSWAVARSPGPRTFAWPRLASFWRRACSAAVRSQVGVVGAVVALIAQCDQVRGGQVRRMKPQILAAAGSCTASGRGPETYKILPSGAAVTCMFMPWRRCLPA